MDFSHLKPISSIFVMILFIAPCFAREARGFTITLPDFNKAYFSLPLDFSFYIAETRKVTVLLGPYYSFEFLKFQEEYNDVELYRENNIGLDVGLKFSQNISSFLDANLALGTLCSFSSTASSDSVVEFYLGKEV